MIKNKDKQPLRKTDSVAVGDVVWIENRSFNVVTMEEGEGFKGPLFVIDIRAKDISTATMYVLHDSFSKKEYSVRIHDIYVPIIDKIPTNRY